MELAFTKDFFYTVFTFVGLLGFWLGMMRKEQLRTEKAGHTSFDKTEYISKYVLDILFSIIVVFTGNIILIEYTSAKQLETWIEYSVISGLSWTGGSVMKYAIEVFPEYAKKFIDKWRSK